MSLLANTLRTRPWRLLVLVPHNWNNWHDRDAYHKMSDIMSFMSVQSCSNSSYRTRGLPFIGLRFPWNILDKDSWTPKSRTWFLSGYPIKFWYFERLYLQKNGIALLVRQSWHLLIKSSVRHGQFLKTNFIIKSHYAGAGMINIESCTKNLLVLK